MLCLCESSISDTMGMLFRFLCLQYGAVHSHGYLGQEHGIERHDREQTVFGVFHCGGCIDQEIDVFILRDGSGYCMDYDLTTDGEINDLTLQIEFLKKGDGYIVSLDDLHTL